jgi:peptidoglycan/LPS O-acetylase OafA/YrhL
MILELFALLIILALFFVVLGFSTGAKVYSIVGFVFLFLLGAWVILYNFTGKVDGLQYRSGLVVNSSSGVDVVSYQYVTYNDETTFWFGFLLSIISLFSVWLVYALGKEGG